MVFGVLNLNCGYISVLQRHILQKNRIWKISYSGKHDISWYEILRNSDISTHKLAPKLIFALWIQIVVKNQFYNVIFSKTIDFEKFYILASMISDDMRYYEIAAFRHKNLRESWFLVFCIQIVVKNQFCNVLFFKENRILNISYSGKHDIIWYEILQNSDISTHELPRKLTFGVLKPNWGWKSFLKLHIHQKKRIWKIS